MAEATMEPDDPNRSSRWSTRLQEAPQGTQKTPRCFKMSQGEAQRPQDVQKCHKAKRAPRWSQDGPKRFKWGPRWSQDAPERPKWSTKMDQRGPKFLKKTLQKGPAAPKMRKYKVLKNRWFSWLKSSNGRSVRIMAGTFGHIGVRGMQIWSIEGAVWNGMARHEADWSL